MGSLALLQSSPWLIFIIIIWVLPWKAYALWTAAKRDHKIWFIVIMIVNTFAILEILYVFLVAKRTPKDILRVFKTKL